MNFSNPASQDHRPLFVAGAFVFLGALICAVASGVDQLAAASIFCGAMLVLVVFSPLAAIVGCFIFLSLQGDIRRYVLVTSGLVANDPLLLVIPVVVMALFALALLQRRLLLQTRVSKLVAAMIVIMTLEIFNPSQGGIAIGLAGVLFFIVPLLWFWIGQAFGSGEFFEKLVQYVLVPLGICAATLGIVQVAFGLFRFEADWFRLTGTQSGAVAGGGIRPFGFLGSWGEYAFYLAATAVVMVAPLFVRRFRLAIIFVPLLAAALVLVSVREAILTVVFSLSLQWAVLGRNAATVTTRLIVAGLFALGALVVTFSQVGNADIDSRINPYLNHTAEGFLDVNRSSAGGHAELVAGGIWYGITHPHGLGLGGPTQASSKLGEGGAPASEIDFGDQFVACGVVGGILYLVLLFSVCRSAIVCFRQTRVLAALYVVAILGSQLGHWLTGGMYFCNALVWFSIGVMDRLTLSSSAQLHAAHADASPAFSRGEPLLAGYQ